MLRGLYSAAAGMIAQQRRHDAVTNNISNLNTPGYKQANLVTRSFPEMLVSLIGGRDQPVNSIGRLNTGVLSEENVSVFLQGDLQETGNASDFALQSNLQKNPPVAFDASGKHVTEDGEVIYQPQAFFTVLDGNGEQRFTRNGKFTLDWNGTMVTADGSRVLGANGSPIVLSGITLGGRTVDLQMSEVKVSDKGQLMSAATGEPILDAAGNPISVLVTRIENPNKLILEGNGNYRLDDPENPPAAVNFANPADPNRNGITIHQGFIERSNVDPAQSMVDLMSALRAYEANQKVIQFYDKSMDKAVNEVGRV